MSNVCLAKHVYHCKNSKLYLAIRHLSSVFEKKAEKIVCQKNYEYHKLKENIIA